MSPTDKKLQVRFHAEEENWYLTPDAIWIGDARSSPAADVPFDLKSAFPAINRTRLYFIADARGLDGGFILAPPGAAWSQLFRSGDSDGLEGHFAGTWVEVPL